MICEFEKTRFGMLKQKNAISREYLESYTIVNSRTNSDMAYLRLGNLLGHVPYDVVFDEKNCHLELGPGNGVNLAIWRSKGIKIEGFDIAKSIYTTISEEWIYQKHFNILCAWDVLEHFTNIDDIFEIDFDYGYFSIPRLPKSGISESWRHFRPNEHIYYCDEISFEKWVNYHGYELLYWGCPEDVIRERQYKDEININSYIIKRI